MFEDGLASQMTNYSRLHVRKDNFSETVNKSRKFENLLSAKKSEKLVMLDTPADHFTHRFSARHVECTETVVEKVLAKQNVKLERNNTQIFYCQMTSQ